ncbi:MAG: F0F1 ATP synthase subunit B [Anaerolineales bacterium]|nr:F0F1 ATP synthase subunit B [Anaerolineales bacterium]
MAALGINIGYLLMQILIITILFFVLRHFLVGPVTNTLEARKERIAKGLEDARQAAIARDNADAEAKRIIEEARQEANDIRKNATVEAEATAKGILDKANDDAKGVMSNARTEAEGERNKILSELRGQVASISIAAARKLVGEGMDEKRQRAVLNEFFAQVPAEVSNLKGETAVVTSALPLTAEEETAAKKAINANTVTFKVDPKILGGLIIRVDDQVVDNSIASQLNELSGSLR